MKKFVLPLFLLFLLAQSVLNAQDFSGNYTMEEGGETVTLTLQQNAEGRVNGAMRSEGVEYTVQGQRKGEELSGFMNVFGESMKFSARFSSGQLMMTLFDPKEGEAGEFSENLIFQRLKGQAVASQDQKSTSGKSKPKSSDKGKVIINGKSLSEEQIRELEQRYTVRPLSGNYWYDTKSGLYGVKGFPAFGFMLAGHDFGELKRDASNGNTGVFVNGRELPQNEWIVWSQLLGYVIQRGRYWLDGQGNAGYEGNPTPTENLYLAAQRNAYHHSGGGGDNFWSSRFGAGNYDSGNQRGYVSVPGYGPVGYGF
jgi:hypothetical protein